MDILNNILDKTHNYLILMEARNTGLIALNLGLLSFYYSANSHLKVIVIVLCLLGTLILAISFLNFSFKSKNDVKIKTEPEEEKEKQIVIKEEDILGVGVKAIKRNNNENQIKGNESEVNKYENLNIYNVKDIVELNPTEYLNLVSNKMEVKGDKILNFIKKEYRFSAASLDLSKEILMTAKMCRFREKVFYIGLYMFIINLLILMIDNLIL